MKLNYGFAFLVFATFMPASMHAELIAAEDFNGYGTAEIKSDGTNLNGGIGWTSAWRNADEKYVPGTSLVYTAAGYDNSGNLGGPEDGAFAYAGNLPGASVSICIRDLATDATTVWFSALISIDEVWDRALFWIDSADPNQTPGWGNDFIGVMDGNIHMRVDGFNITDAGPPTVGTHLLLAKAEINVSGTNDRLTYWFDPDLSGGEAGLGEPTYMDDFSDTFGDTIDGVAVMLVDRDMVDGNIVTDPDDQLENGEIIDAIRVGTTLDDVISPPPAPPAAPEITSVTRVGDTLTVQFTGEEGASYGLNKSENLEFTVPNIVDTVTVSGGTGTLEDSGATGDSSFYRVESQE